MSSKINGGFGFNLGPGDLLIRILSVETLYFHDCSLLDAKVGVHPSHLQLWPSLCLLLMWGFGGLVIFIRMLGSW